MGKSLKGKELGTGITQRKDGRYSAKFKSVTGQRVEKYFDKLAEARKWLTDAKYDDSHGNGVYSQNMTVDAWFVYWIAEIKKNTVRWGTIKNYQELYKSFIKDLIGHMIISDIKPLHCQNVLNQMHNHDYSGATMQSVKAVLGVLFSDALENGLISVNPVTKSVKCPKRPEKRTRVLTMDEQKKFLTVAKENAYYLHFLFILQTGIRLSELRGLRWNDVDFKNRVIHIQRNTVHNSTSYRFITGELKTKSGLRDIPMTETAYHALSEIRTERAKQQSKVISFEFADHVFLNQNGKLITNANYNTCLKQLCKKAEIEDISMHTLRHTFATRCIESGMKPKVLQKILGHANISMTMDLYVHVTDDMAEKEMRLLEQMYEMAQ